MRTKAIVFFFLLVALPLSARQRSDEELKAIAKGFLQSERLRTKRANPISKTYSIAQHLEHVSIVAEGQNAFVIVTNDDSSKPIVGYSFTEYNDKEVPENFQWWLRAMNASIAKNAQKALLPAGLPESVSPLLRTTWGQMAPFNRLCPSRFPTGCVATAMAQFMYYYRYPLQGTGTHANGDLTFDYGNTVFQWGNMLASYDEYNVQQANAVATLMLACGIAVDMVYESDGSGAYFSDIVDALKDHFGYQKGNLYNRNSYADDWMGLIYNELSGQRPVLYGGQNESNGHVFIIDGYDAEGNVHINWGWNGNYDGYFDINALDPEGDGGYNQQQQMIVGCREYEPHPNLTTMKFTTSGTTLPNDSQTIKFSITNDGIAFNGSVNLFLSQSETELGSKVKSKSLSLENEQSKELSFSITPESAGTYYLTLTSDEDGKNIIGTGTLIISDNTETITFQDPAVKAICVANWDKNGDGELSYGEAAAVNSIGFAFKGSNIISFDELRYFKGLTSIEYSAFADCENLVSITIPEKVSSIKVGLKEGYIESAFLGCSGLKSIRVEKGNSYYDSRNDCNAIIETASNELIIGCQNTMIPDDIKIIGTAAFYKCTGLTSISIPEGVTSIFVSAFEYCSNLASLALPESVGYIGCNAFANCTSLTSINIPQRVTSIESMTFWVCTSLQSVTIPESITFIGSRAFWGCSSLTSITIPKSVRTICREAFSSCSGLTSMKVDEGNPIFDSREDCNAIIETSTNLLCAGCQSTMIPQSVTAIAANAFDGMTSLTSITIPEGVTTIGGWAFDNCTGLTSITIPSSVTDIGMAAFQDCENLTSIVLQDGLTNIGDWAFNLCRGLTSVTIPDGVHSIGSHAFYQCGKLTTVVLGANVENIGDEAFPCLKVVKCYAEDVPSAGNNAFHKFEKERLRTLMVPEKSIEKYKITSPWNEFEAIVAIEAIDGFNVIFADAIAKSICVTNWDTDGDGELSRTEAVLVETIGREFENSDITSFDELQYFTGLYRIDYNIFNGCSNLTSICIPKNVTFIAQFAFRGCDNLTSIHVDSGNPVYDSREDCNAIIETTTNTLLFGCKGTVIPHTVTAIGVLAFSGCSGLTSIIIPNSVTSIGDHAFVNCKDLSSVTMSSSVTSIGNDAFLNCKDLSSVTLPSSVTSIGASAFCQSGLTSIVIPDGVTKIAKETFSGCQDLFSVQMSNNVTDIESEAFSQCYALSSINISESVTSIGRIAFNHCINLKEITIPDKVKTIGIYAFNGCYELSSIRIGSGITEIADCAFSNCNSIKDVFCYAEKVPTTEVSAFSDAITSAILHVPASAIEDYRKTAPWSSFGSIVPLDGVGIEDVHVKDDVTPWYTLDGRTLNGKPATKGIYVRGGKKVLVK